jgi:hypothetical protein
MCQRELGDIESMSIVGFEREYLDGLREVAARRRDGQSLLVLFLGSTIEISTARRPPGSPENAPHPPAGRFTVAGTDLESLFLNCWQPMMIRWELRRRSI